MIKKLQTLSATHYVILIASLILTLGNIFLKFPLVGPARPDTIFPLYQETFDLLVLLLVIYASNKINPRWGMGLIAWFISLFLIKSILEASFDFSATFRQLVLVIVAALGMRIIGVRNRLQRRLEEDAAREKDQRSIALKYAEELLVLNGIATLGVEATSEEDLIRDAVQVMDAALHPDFFDIGVIDRKHGKVHLYRSSRTWDGGNIDIPLERGITGKVIATGKSLRVPDVSCEPAYMAVSSEVRSELCIPLKIGQQVIGVINIESKQVNAFSESDERMITTLADQLVIALQKVRLFQSEQRHAQEAETLREAGSIVAATLSQEEAIQRILEQLRRVIPYDSASVQLLRDGHMEIVGVRGWADPKEALGLRFPVPGDNPNTIVVKTRQPYVLGDAPSVYKAFEDGPHRHIRSFLGVPLIAGQQILGMLAVDHTQPGFFEEHHIRLALAFADQVAITVQHTRLFSELEYLARVDELTGLDNRRYFLIRSQHEFLRARRYTRTLAAVMVDVDHFKQVNDTYGHAVGDEVLCTMAQRCKKAVRQIDILGRYGGEEFVSLVIDADLDGARIVAERLRHSIADVPINTEKGPVHVTISLGIALLDPQCKDLDELLRRADQALYAAKQAGRNRASIWQATE